MSVGRVPPHNLEAEASLLGAMLLSRDAVSAALGAEVSDEDFYQPAHAHIFGAVKVLYDRAEPVDVVTVADELIIAKQRNGPTRTGPNAVKLIFRREFVRFDDVAVESAQLAMSGGPIDEPRGY